MDRARFEEERGGTLLWLSESLRGEEGCAAGVGGMLIRPWIAWKLTGLLGFPPLFLFPSLTLAEQGHLTLPEPCGSLPVLSPICLDMVSHSEVAAHRNPKGLKSTLTGDLLIRSNIIIQRYTSVTSSK